MAIYTDFSEVTTPFYRTLTTALKVMYPNIDNWASGKNPVTTISRDYEYIDTDIKKEETVIIERSDGRRFKLHVAYINYQVNFSEWINGEWHIIKFEKMNNNLGIYLLGEIYEGIESDECIRVKRVVSADESKILNEGNVKGIWYEVDRYDTITEELIIEDTFIDRETIHNYFKLIHRTNKNYISFISKFRQIRKR
jgi:hypothetical protein